MCPKYYIGYTYTKQRILVDLKFKFNCVLLVFLFAKFSILVGEGNGNPLQCSCLENPRDGGAWWAAVYGVI